MCVFCYDGLLCPVQKRILQAAGAREIPTKPVIVGAPTVENTIALAGVLLQRRRIMGSTEEQEVTMAEAICAKAGCDKKLANNNTTGLCQEHGGHHHNHNSTPAVHGTCTTPGCGARLASNNSSGLCKIHGGAEGPHRARGKIETKIGSTVPGNGNASGHANGSGHASSAAPVAHRSDSKTGNGHAGNGHHTNGNGHAHPPRNGHDLAIEARVELVMSKIPLAEKLAFISRWVSGES